MIAHLAPPKAAAFEGPTEGRRKSARRPPIDRDDATERRPLSELPTTGLVGTQSSQPVSLLHLSSSSSVVGQPIVWPPSSHAHTPRRPSTPGEGSSRPPAARHRKAAQRLSLLPNVWSDNNNETQTSRSKLESAKRNSVASDLTSSLRRKELSRPSCPEPTKSPRIRETAKAPNSRPHLANSNGSLERGHKSPNLTQRAANDSRTALRWPKSSFFLLLVGLLHLLLASHLSTPVSSSPSNLVSSRWSRHAADQPAPDVGGQQQPNQRVPYKSFQVTRACEWKSNLFVPKSNDVHFAQPVGQPPQQPASVVESSVLYEFAGSSRLRGQQQQQQQQQSSDQQPQLNLADLEPKQRRTLLWTESRALVLSLPISMAPGFAGFEPACSIRLVVPRNMRILAKLTSRRLTFAAEQLAADQEAATQTAPIYDATGRLQPFQQPPSLWLNVSQNPFVETEQRVIETEGNVIGFRFLLDRFAARQQPEIRFQVVLTAFQTLSDNSDNSQQFYPPSGSSLEPQFICDQQRLISSSLACDGFKNCQDGHDEEEATCLVLRNQQPKGPQHELTQNHQQQQQQQPGSNLLAGQTSKKPSSIDQDDHGLWWRIRTAIWPPTGSLVVLLLWLILLLVLLIGCCLCSVYLLRIMTAGVWHSRRRRDVIDRTISPADHSVLVAQNLENLAKMKGSLEVQSRPSILKRTNNLPALMPPTQLAKQRPNEPPPPRPPRGALSSRLAEPSSRNSPLQTSSYKQQQQQQQQFQNPLRPVPARRQSRPSSTILVSNSGLSVAPPSPSRPFSPPKTNIANTSSNTSGLAEPITGLQRTRNEQTIEQFQHREESSNSIHQQHQTTSSVLSSSSTQSTSNRRISTYHYSFGTTRMTDSYLERLASSHQQTSGSQASQTRLPSRPPSYRHLIHTGTRPANESGDGEPVESPPPPHESSALI